MLKPDFNRAAKQELFDSADYYANQGPDLAERFLQEVEGRLQEIAASPSRYPTYFTDIRRCVMSGFPYGIYYRVLDDKIRVLAIAHFSRHPAYWKHRK